MSETDHVPGNVAPISPAMIFTSPLHPHPIGLYTAEECRSIRPTNVWCDNCNHSASGAAFLCVDESSSTVHHALFCFKCVVQANQKQISSHTNAPHMFQIESGNASHAHRLSAVATLPPNAYPSPHPVNDGDQPIDTQTFTCAFCHREQLPAGHYRCAGADGTATGSSPDACLFDVCISCVATHVKSGGWTIAIMTSGPNAFDAAAPTIKEKKPVMQLHVVTKNVQDKPPTFAARALGLCSALEIKSAAPALQTCAACENTVLGCGFLSIPKGGKPEDADGPIFCSRCVFESDEKSSPTFRKALRHPKHEHQLQNTCKLREGEMGFKCLVCASETKRVGHYSCKHPGCKVDICIDCAHATLLSKEATLEKVEPVPAAGEVISKPAEKAPEGKLLDKSAPAEKSAETKPTEKPVEKPAEEEKKAEELKPETKPVEKPAEEKLEEKSTVETKIADTTPPTEPKPVETKPPAEEKPAEVITTAVTSATPVENKADTRALAAAATDSGSSSSSASHPAELVSASEIAENHKKLPLHLQLCSFCLVSTVIYNCPQCVTAMVDPLSCGTCYRTNHISAKMKSHQATRQIVQGVDEAVTKDDQRSRAQGAGKQDDEDEDYSLDEIETTSEEIKSEHVAAAPVPAPAVAAAAAVPAPVVTEVKQSPVVQPAKPPVVEEEKIVEVKREPTPVKATEPVLASTPKRSASPEVISEPIEEEQPEPAAPTVKPAKKKSKKKKQVSLAAEPTFEDKAAREAEQARLLAEWEALHYNTNGSNSKKKKSSKKKKKSHIPPFPDTSRAGMLEHVFALLSQERIMAEENSSRPPALKGFDLPFSVLFHNSNPHSTLSTDTDGFVKQLQWGSSPLAKTEAVLERFLNTPISGPNAYTTSVARNPDDAVALCFSANNNTDALALNTAQLKLLFGIVEPEAEHSDPSNVGSQHSAERPRGNFLLQRFIPSPGAHSTMYRVRADWIGLDEADPPALTLSVCTNPNGREDSKRASGQLKSTQNLAVPISHALAIKSSLVKEVAFYYDARDGMSPQFQRLCTQMRDSIAALGMGRPIRLSVVVAPSRKIDALSGAEEESIGEESAFEENEQMDASASSSEYKWHFCFADLIQLQSVESVLPPPAPAAENAAAVASPEPVAAASPTSSPTTTNKKEKPRKSIKLTQAVVPRKILHDATECGKCNRVFLSRDESHLIYLKQVLLKWVPNSLFEYPEDLFHNLLGVDNQREADWYKCVIKICSDCRDEIRALKTIPSRTQLAPWLKAAADSSIIATPKVDDSQPVTLLALPPTTAVLPYLAKAPVLHPDAPGFGGILSPPKAETTHKKTKKPMSDLLYPSESAAIAAATVGTKYHAAAVAQLHSSKSTPALRMIHPIAGGAGTAPTKPHHPKSRHHRSSDMNVDAAGGGARGGGGGDDYGYDDDEEDEGKKNYSSNSNGNGAFLPSLSKQQSAPVFSPFSSGQKRAPPMVSDSPPATTAALSHGMGGPSAFTYGYESAQDLRERERERALAKAMKQNKMISPTQQQSQQQQMRRAQSQGTLAPLSSSPQRGAHFVAPLQKKESVNGYVSPPPATRSSPSPHSTPPLQPYATPGSPMQSKSVPQNVLASNQRQGSVPNRVERAAEEDEEEETEETIEEIEEYPEEKFQ